MQKFERTIEVRWSDVDQNRHVRHSAYYDYGAHARIKFFEANGFTSAQMGKLNIGPIIFKEECSFIRELGPGETLTVNVLNGGVSEDGARWTLHHEIFNSKGEKSAHITLKGAWMDLAKRKLTLPPAEVKALIPVLPKGDAYLYKKS